MTEEQRQRVTTWITEGAKLSEIQNRLLSEFKLKFTYMEVRFLVDDLKLTPKDPEPPKVVVAANYCACCNPRQTLPLKKIPRRKERCQLPAFP